MPQTSLMPVVKQQFFDDNGDPLASGKVYFYEPGTTTEKSVYSDSNGNTALSNPVILDAAGRAEIWYDGYYKSVVKDANDVTVSTTDNTSSQYSQSITSTEFVDQSDTPTYISATQFSVTGNETADYQVGRRIKATVTAGTVYGTITASSSGGDPLITTVTVVNDSGGLDSGLSAVALGILTTTNSSIPTFQTLSKTANYTMDMTVRNKKIIMSANAVTLTLIGANSAYDGFEFEFINAGANQMTLNGTVNGFANVTFLQYESAKLFSDGANWFSMNMHNQDAVGTVKSWHKSMTGIPQILPWGWVECDGSVINDSESPANGQTLPDLNNNGRFIRGSNTSGTTQANQNLEHSHADTISGNGGNLAIANNFTGNNSHIYVDTGGNPLNFDPAASGLTWQIKEWTLSDIAAHINSNTIAESLSINGANSGSTESRPDNISMVYIIKIK